MRALLGVVAVLSFSMSVSGHGRMIEPPARSTAWRYGFPTPHNYDDMSLFCGGFARKQQNGGKCGVCGDPWNGLRENEAGGKYATGTIVRNYTMGQVITLSSDITANHYGWMEYRICPNNDVTKVVSQDCLDQHLLQMADGSGSRYVLPSKNTGVYSIKVKLPDNMVCSQCVIQWKYHAGNSWGVDESGRACIGCGPQEEFYGCADVSIRAPGGVLPVTAAPTATPIPVTFAPVTQAPPATQAPSATLPPVASTLPPVQATTQGTGLPVGFVPLGNTVINTNAKTGCHAINNWAGDPTLDKWCADSCAAGNCPLLACACSNDTTTRPTPTDAPTTRPTTTPTTTTTPKPTTTTPKPTTTPTTTTPRPTTTSTTTTATTTARLPCHGINLWAGNPVLDQYCTTACAIGNCPADACACDSTFKVPSTTVPTAAPTTTTTTTTTTPKPTTTTTTPTTTTPTTPTPTTSTITTPTTTTPSVLVTIKCVAINAWAGNDYLDRWCADSCARGNCPEDSCRCTKTEVPVPKATVYTDFPPPTTPTPSPAKKECTAVGQFAGQTLFDIWCTEQCNQGNCPDSTCTCKDSVGGNASSMMSSTQNPLLVPSYKHCVSNGREVGDYWNGWCQDSCNRGSCPIDYCNCS